MRVVFAGTPDFSVPSLAALVAADVDVVGVYCQPDRRSGRGRKLVLGPVKALALEHGLRVYQPDRFDDRAVDEFASTRPDLAIVVAYGLLLPQTVLDLPRLGCVNVHASLLPRWRGAAPIARAIEHGDDETGISLMQMDVGLDTGDVLATATHKIGARADACTLHDALAALGARVLVDNLDALISQSLIAEPQNDSESSYAKKITKEEATIDWSLTADVIDRKIRALVAWPVAKTAFKDEVWKIWAAEPDEAPSPGHGHVQSVDSGGMVVGCADRCLRITQLQRPGGRRLPCDAFFKGLRDKAPQVGDRFASRGASA